MDCIYDELLDILEIAKTEEHEAWSTFYADSFEEINYTFDSLNKDENFKNELLAKGYTFDIRLGKYSNSPTLTFLLNNDKGERITEVFSTNIPKLDSTLFIAGSNTGPIYFVLNHSKKEMDEKKPKYLYIYKNPLELKDFDSEEKKFWEDHVKEGLCFATDFNKNTLVRALKLLFD